MSSDGLVAVPRDGERADDRQAPSGLRLTQAAREGAMEAWLEILSQRHPEVVWVPKQTLDLARTRS